MSPQSSHHPVDIASGITLRWTWGHSVLPRALGTGLVAGWVADAGPRWHRYAVGPRPSIVIALPGDGVDGACHRHDTPAPARL
jgi:hypothetical protein